MTDVRLICINHICIATEYPSFDTRAAERNYRVFRNSNPNNSPENTCCSTLYSVEPTISGLRRLLELELAELSLLGGAGLLCLRSPTL